ncbi:hypothetical protein D9615_002407 [Tricholomella constricta]|uniref:Uncharacterized protein n=1 Tax=Tricholomella constricta TaxID=117010 RepID=A0A8H5HMJ8_9AGAR|nr:hypothetical protein D9615_002407 [Tricholomella constricta]
MPYTVGPFKPPPVSQEQPSDTFLPDYDPAFHPFTGLELTVSGLDRSGPRSANEHLKRIISKLEDDGLLLPKLDITPGASRTSNEASDYVTVSLADPYRATPRPDVLEFVRQTLDDVPDISARWRILHGPDKSRQLSFFARSKEEAPGLKEKLERVFKQEHYDVQSSWTWQGQSSTPRLTFNFVSRKAVENLLIKSPVLDNHTYVPIEPTYVQPVYGLEVAVSNVGGFPQAQLMIDSYIRNKYGTDAWRSSRLELNGTVYCVVLRDPDVTTRFLTDPFEAFPENCTFRPNKPDYLYNVNSAGIPNTMRSQSFQQESPAARQQMDSLIAQVTTTQRSIQYVMEDHRKLAESLATAQDRFASMFSSATAIQTAQGQLMLAQSDLNNLRSAMSTAQLLLSIERSPDNQRRIQGFVDDLSDRIVEAQNIVSDFRQDVRQLQASNMPFVPRLLSSISSADVVHPASSPHISGNQPVAPPGLTHPSQSLQGSTEPRVADPGSPSSSFSPNKRPRLDSATGDNHDAVENTNESMEVDKPIQPSDGSQVRFLLVPQIILFILEFSFVWKVMSYLLPPYASCTPSL